MFAKYLKILGVLCALFGSVTVKGQAESNNPYTRDTLIVTYVNGANFPSPWWVRITTQRGNSTPRPSIFCIPGAGETGSDTTFFVPPSVHSWGVHYWLASGWDGGVQLGNGKHYPNLFTLMQPAVNQRPWELNAIMDSLIKYYPILTTSIHVMGLSEGNWCWQCLLGWYPTTGAFPGMTMIKSMVDLEGVTGENDFNAGASGPGSGQNTYAPVMAYWAQNYGGKFLGLEGTTDSRNIWQLTQAMNTAAANSAYFCYQTFGGGAHCCWNQMYDPGQTNWTDVGPGAPGNPNLSLTTNPASTAGTYSYNPITGSNIFQWALRQGDTALKGSIGVLPACSAGSNQTIQYPFVKTATLAGTATPGTGHTIVSTVWSLVSYTVDGSAATGVTPVFSNANILNPTVTISNPCSGNFCSIGGRFTFQLTVTDDIGQQANSSMVIMDSIWANPTVSAGSPQTVVLPNSSTVLAGSASGNRGATITSLSWVRVSGPSLILISNANVLNPTISALQAGTYVMQLTAVDNNGEDAQSSVTITVQGGGTTTPVVKGSGIAGTGEYQAFWLDTLTHKIHCYGTNYNTLGVGGTGTLGTNLLLNTGSITFSFVAGGLHGGTAVSTGGVVYAWGDHEQGQIGDGTVNNTALLTPVAITTDSAGNTLPAMAYTAHFYAGNAAEGYYMVSADSTKLYVVGYTALTGMKGVAYSTATDTCKRPTLIPTPAGKKIAQVVAGGMLLVRFSDSTVYTSGNANISGSILDWYDLGYPGTGNQFLALHLLSGLSGVTQVFGGNAFNGAVKSNGKIMGWGYYSSNLCDGSTSGYGVHWAVPTEMTIVEAALPVPILIIKANSSNIACILQDHTLWSFGDNAQGGVGIGSELNYFNTFYPTPATPTPFAWDFLPGDLLVTSPVRIGTASDWIDISGGGTFLYYWWGQHLSGEVDSWGRNKGAVCGNGVVPCSSNQAALYPNAWDVLVPTAIHPTTQSTTTVIPCIYCAYFPSAQYCGDAGCFIPVINTAGGVPFNKSRRKHGWH